MRNIVHEQPPLGVAPPAQAQPVADAHPEPGPAPASIPATRRTRRAQRETAYDRITRVLGLAMAALLLLALWVTGGYFTLLWLARIGFAPASPGVALADWLLQRGPAVTSHWLSCLVAWSIPLAITLAEVGLWPTRTRHPFTWALFVAVLLFSSFTSAAGIAVSLKLDPLSSWVIGAIVGVAIDLAPEKGWRVLWRLLTEA